MHQMIDDPFVVIIPLALFLGTILAGLVARKLLFGAVRRWAKASDSQLDVLLIDTLRRPIDPLDSHSGSPFCHSEFRNTAAAISTTSRKP